jgi:murein DD-endopeptidase MepM/ murein hydrolase activator NlpD
MARRETICSHLAGLARAVGELAWDALAEGADRVRAAAARGPREFFRSAGVLAARIAGWAAATALAFVLAGALVAAHVANGFLRGSIVVLLLFAVPLALVYGTPLGRRRGVATAWSLTVALTLVVGGGRHLGGTIRRHGDWFLGQRTDRAAVVWRGAIAGTGALLEWFTIPPEMLSHTLPLDEAPRFYGPWRSGETPYPPEPVQVRWVHPLGDGQRVLPSFESRRFGAVRPQPRPWECELGHCGVDLAAPMGELVVAVADGVVERVERNAAAGGNAGRYVRVAHLDGTVVTRYIHLDTIRRELHPGLHVVAGEPLGTVGRTGVVENFPHLHFGLSLRAADGSERYVDPEPFLRSWESRSDPPRGTLPPAMIALN